MRLALVPGLLTWSENLVWCCELEELEIERSVTASFPPGHGPKGIAALHHSFA